MGVAIAFTSIQIVLECCKSTGVAVAFTSSQIVLECCKSAGVVVAFTSSQIVLECCKSAGVAVAFTRLVDSMSSWLGCGKDSSTHQFRCISEEMEIHRLDFRNLLRQVRFG